jgi:hypothetical protein
MSIESLIDRNILRDCHELPIIRIEDGFVIGNNLILYKYPKLLSQVKEYSFANPERSLLVHYTPDVNSGKRLTQKASQRGDLPLIIEGANLAIFSLMLFMEQGFCDVDYLIGSTNNDFAKFLKAKFSGLIILESKEGKNVFELDVRNNLLNEQRAVCKMQSEILKARRVLAKTIDRVSPIKVDIEEVERLLREDLLNGIASSHLECMPIELIYKVLSRMIKEDGTVLEIPLIEHLVQRKRLIFLKNSV